MRELPPAHEKGGSRGTGAGRSFPIPSGRRYGALRTHWYIAGRSFFPSGRRYGALGIYQARAGSTVVAMSVCLFRELSGVELPGNVHITGCSWYLISGTTLSGNARTVLGTLFFRTENEQPNSPYIHGQ